jgi:hypothetical protein
MRIGATGTGTVRVGINTTTPLTTLDVNGTVTATTFNATSDYRIKENIRYVDLNEYNIDRLKPVVYNYRNDKTTSIGLIAHEVQPYFPFLVLNEKDGDATQSVNYIGLIGVLIKEVQSLKARVSSLEEQLEERK